jgi:hypothetical protein
VSLKVVTLDCEDDKLFLLFKNFNLEKKKKELQLGRGRQEDFKFTVSLGYTGNLRLSWTT